MEAIAQTFVKRKNQNKSVLVLYSMKNITPIMLPIKLKRKLQPGIDDCQRVKKNNCAALKFNII